MWSLDPADTSIPITQVTSDSPEMGGLTTPPTLFYSASTKSSPPSHIRYAAPEHGADSWRQRPFTTQFDTSVESLHK